jgi:hypothetical protein
MSKLLDTVTRLMREPMTKEQCPHFARSFDGCMSGCKLCRGTWFVTLCPHCEGCGLHCGNFCTKCEGAGLVSAPVTPEERHDVRSHYATLLKKKIANERGR